MIYAVIGLILVILSYSIVQLLTSELVKGINPPSPSANIQNSAAYPNLQNTTGTYDPSSLITQPSSNSLYSNPNIQGGPQPVTPPVPTGDPVINPPIPQY
jgi:hypothetical protein